MSKPKLIIFLYFLNSKNKKKIYINTKTNQFSGFQELRKKKYLYIYTNSPHKAVAEISG